MLSYDDDCQRKGRLWWLRMVTSPSCVGRRPDMRDRLGKVRAAQPGRLVDPYTVRPHHSTPHEHVPGCAHYYCCKPANDVMSDEDDWLSAAGSARHD